MFVSRLCHLKFLYYVGKCEFVDSKLSIVIVYGIRSKLQPRPVLSLPWMSTCPPKPPPWGLRKPLSSKLCRSPPRLPEGALKSWSVEQRRTVHLNSTVVENLALLVIYKKIWFESVFYVTFFESHFTYRTRCIWLKLETRSVHQSPHCLICWASLHFPMDLLWRKVYSIVIIFNLFCVGVFIFFFMSKDENPTCCEFRTLKCQNQKWLNPLTLVLGSDQEFAIIGCLRMNSSQYWHLILKGFMISIDRLATIWTS